mgnify:CR=1 FL=1
MIRVILPIVVDTDESRIAAMTGQDPERFECEPAIFYSIDNVRPYKNYKNICEISSGGQDFIVGLSPDEVDILIQDSSEFMRIGAN